MYFLFNYQTSQFEKISLLTKYFPMFPILVGYLRHLKKIGSYAEKLINYAHICKASYVNRYVA